MKFNNAFCDDVGVVVLFQNRQNPFSVQVNVKAEKSRVRPARNFGKMSDAIQVR